MTDYAFSSTGDLKILQYHSNHATTNLAIYSNETSQDRLSEALIDNLLLSSRCMTNYMKICSFLHPHFTETMKVVANLFFKKSLWWNNYLLKRHMLYVHIGIASMRQFQYVPTTYVTKNKENYFEIYTYQVLCPLSLPLLTILNCLSVLKYLSLYCKLFIFAWQLYLQNQMHELTLC